MWPQPTIKVSPSSREDRGDNFEEVIERLTALSRGQKELALEYLREMVSHETSVIRPRHKLISIISSLEQLAARYSSVDFSGFVVRDNDKEQYQLWKLIDAFEESVKQMGRVTFDKLRITLVVFGRKITYMDDGTIILNYERFSKEDLVKQLILMSRQQG